MKEKPYKIKQNLGAFCSFLSTTAKFLRFCENTNGFAIV